MSEQIEVVSSKMPLFSKKKDWIQWSEIFLAKAESKGYYDLMVGDETSIPKSTATDLSDKETSIYKLNTKAFGDLISTMNLDKAAGREGFQICYSTKSEDWKHGNVALAWKMLEKKFNPKTTPELSMVTEEFYSAKLKPNQDPDNWITELVDLRNQMAMMGFDMDDRQFMIHIMNRLTSDYSTTVELLEDGLGSSKDECTLTMEQLRNKLTLKYKRIKKDDKETGKEEVALFARTNDKRCHQCGKIGHIV